MLNVVLIMPSAVNGGVQRVMINLAKGMIQEGAKVDFFIADAEGEMGQLIPAQCHIYDQKKRRYRGDLKIFMSIWGLHCLMKKEPNAVFIAAPGLSGTVLAFLKIMHRKSKTMVILDNKCSLLKKGTLYHKVVYHINKFAFKFVDMIITAHNQAFDDVKKNYKIKNEKIYTIYHPLIDRKKISQTYPESNHPYVVRGNDQPLLLAVGRLVPEKDFETLIKAVNIVREKQKVNLIILGEGPLRNRLQAEINAYELQNSVDLYGYSDNVYGFMKAANLLVLSSEQEAFGNVLVEALACGTPVVATDCSSGGPREILKSDDCNLYGALCPCKNSVLLAKAIEETLQKQFDELELITRGNEFSIENSAKAYLQVARTLLQT